MPSTPSLRDRLSAIADDAVDSRDFPLAQHLGLDATHVPELVAIARTWPGSWHEKMPASDVPMLACRALAQLGDIRAVTTLLAMLTELEEADDDTYLEELPELALAVGPSAIDPLAAYALERSHLVHPRIATTDALERLALRHEAERARIVGVHAQLLAQLDPTTRALGGNVVGVLAELGAVEHADAMRDAFEAGFVDPMICGRWEEVAWNLGIGPKPPREPWGWDRAPDASEPAATSSDRAARDAAARAKNKATRKQQKAARKKSRARR